MEGEYNVHMLYYCCTIVIGLLYNKAEYTMHILLYGGVLSTMHILLYGGVLSTMHIGHPCIWEAST